MTMTMSSAFSCQSHIRASTAATQAPSEVMRMLTAFTVALPRTAEQEATYEAVEGFYRQQQWCACVQRAPG